MQQAQADAGALGEQQGAQKEARVRLYGCLKPVVNRRRVFDQLRAAHKYQNDLIALERCRRQVYRQLRGEHVDLSVLESEVEALSTQLGEVRGAIRAERAQARARKVVAALNQRARELQARLIDRRRALKEARKQAREDPVLQEAVRALDERAKVWAKALRATTECYWGTYLLIEASVDQARKATVDPSFRRRSLMELGRLGVQVQGGMTVAELLAGKDQRVRLIPAESKWQGRAKTERGLRSKVRHMLYLRVGSDGRAPIWAVFPMIMHRPIPEDAIIKGVVVRRRVIGLAERWSASITFTREAVPLPQKQGVLAMDLGWRKRPDASLRVAYWVDDQGRHGEVLMPANIRDRLRHADSLREIQDRRFNRTIHALTRWCDKAEVRLTLPEWLKADRPFFSKWRSHQRLHRFIGHWRAHRFDGDRKIFGVLARWVTKSNHLYAWESHERSRALGHRREIYRVAAAQMAREYGTVIVEDFDILRAKRLKAPEADNQVERPRRAQLQSAAPGEFRESVMHAVQREGGVVAKLNAFGTTSFCHQCGGDCTWNQDAEIWHTCEHCGALWDQDFNAAMNLLRNWKTEGRPSMPRRTVSAKPRLVRKKRETAPSTDARRPE